MCCKMSDKQCVTVSCWMIVSKVKKYGKESWQLALYNKLDNMNLMTVGTAHWSAFGPPLMIWKVYSPKLGRNYINKCVARWVINNALLFPVEWSFLKWKNMAKSHDSLHCIINWITWTWWLWVQHTGPPSGLHSWFERFTPLNLAEII